MADRHPDRGLIPGWSHPGEFDSLVAWASACPGPWVELGSYCGRSTVRLGQAAKEAGTVLFAVDPHRGNPEMRPGRECHHPEVWAREHGSLSVLIDNIRAFDLEGTVLPVVGPGNRFALCGVEPGFVFVDADHSYEACRADYDTWKDRTGMLAFHDAEHAGPAQVVEQAQADGWRLVCEHASLRVLQKP